MIFWPTTSTGSDGNIDEEGGCVLHVLVDAFVPENMMGVVLARIDANNVTDRAWVIPGLA